MYTERQAKEASLKYFNDDELATNVFLTKYCLKDGKGNFVYSDIILLLII